MLLNTDYLAMIIVTAVALYVAWDARRIKSPVYLFMKVILVVIALIWLMALGLYISIN
jgi:hypothetical protein